MKTKQCVWINLFAFVFAVMSCGSVSAATECVWKGGSSGDIFDESNWSPAHVPSSQNVTAYVAVFTNSVTLSSSSYWYPAGFIVSNNAAVVMSGSRLYPSTACEDSSFKVHVENSSSFTFNSTIFYGSTSLALVKTGGGILEPKGWCGNANSSGVQWGSADVRGGTLKFSGSSGFVCIVDTLRIRSGAVVTVANDNQFAFRIDKNFAQPVVEIDEGGVFNANGKALVVSALSGAGVVTNCSNTLTMNLRTSGKSFAGRIVGGGTLAVTPDTNWTAADATWTVAAPDALWGVSLARGETEGCSYDVRFASGIDTFYAKSIPEDAPCFDTNGVPVEIARSGNFWYVDCNRKGTAGDGKSLATAFQTLKEASENAALAGDTIWVAPGVYSNGAVAVVQGAITSSNRVSVAADVRLVALGSPANTIIEGASSLSPISDGYGIGAGAVRCAKLGARATLRGFTLRGGRSCSTSLTAQGEAYYGSGICADRTSVIIDCVISNCVATRGGGAYQGNYFNCRFYSNRATGGPNIGAQILERAKLYNCVLDGGLGACDWYANKTDSLALNCTFGPNGANGIRGTGPNEGEHVVVRNSLVMVAPASGACDEYHNSIISPRGSSSATFDESCIATNRTATTTPTIYAFAGIDKKTLRPKSAKSILVGAADLATYRSLFPVAQYWLSEYDADGNRRVWGDSLDIGAFAYDRNRAIPGLVLTFR